MLGNDSQRILAVMWFHVSYHSLRCISRKESKPRLPHSYKSRLRRLPRREIRQRTRGVASSYAKRPNVIGCTQRHGACGREEGGRVFPRGWPSRSKRALSPASSMLASQPTLTRGPYCVIFPSHRRPIASSRGRDARSTHILFCGFSRFPCGPCNVLGACFRPAIWRLGVRTIVKRGWRERLLRKVIEGCVG